MSIREERVTIKGAFSIGATIAHTDNIGKSPAVLIIMGTGKTDRDGNLKNFKTDLYKNLSDFFVESGFVCARYDKRGTHQSTGNYNTAGVSDLTEDAIAVVKYLKALPYVDSERIIICGHSEGVMLASLLAKKELVAGLLLLGGAGLSMKDALLYQNRLAVEEFRTKKGLLGLLLKGQANQTKMDAKVEALFSKCMNAQKDRVFFGGVMMNAKWVSEHGSYTSEDFVKMLGDFGKPVLAITGTADLSADYRTLQMFGDMKHVQTYAPERVNHMLRVIDDGNSMMTVQKQYKRLASQPIHKETEEVITQWLQQFV